MRWFDGLTCFMGAWLMLHATASAACISDTDGDGVCDNVDLCPNTIPGATVDSNGCPPVIRGDYDRDGDVDPGNLEIMAVCHSGPGIPATPGCLAGDFDFDLDTDVDLDDFGAFQRCFSGADHPADPNCAAHLAYIVNGCLQIVGTAASTDLALRLQPGTSTMLQIDVGNNGSADFSFDRSQFNCIVVKAGAGEDVVQIDEVNGVFTDTELTTILGGNGNDSLFGGSGPETFIGGDGADSIFMGGGNDTFIWNPGDDTDLVEGSGDHDTVEVNGANGDEQFTVTANGTRVRFDRISPAPFFLDIGTCEELVLSANGGNDSLACTGNLAPLIHTTADGGPGDDTLLGSNGNDFLNGGDNNDFIDGQQGLDTVFMGAGDDVFQWDPGDGNDTVEGQAGHDIVLFNGSNGAEIFAFSASGQRLLFTRNLGSVVMDADDIEQFDLSSLGNTDTITVNDLSGTDVAQVNVDLAGTIGGNAGDAAADTLIVNASSGDDTISVVGAGTAFAVAGLAAQINVANSEGASDALVINTLGGADDVTATTLPAGVVKLTLDGGSEDDVLLGSQGSDVFLGGEGHDFILGDNGSDVALMGSGNDVFQWDPGDGNDTLEGQDGSDTMLFFGSNSAENVDIVPNGGRVLFIRNVGSVTMDLNDVETIDFRALGAADNIVVGDLSGTDVTKIDLDLRGPDGGGDAAADTITVNGTNGADVFGAAGDAAGITVFGLQATVNIVFQEQANDRLTLNALGEDDVVDATALEADGIQLTMNGGLGDDVFFGSEGNDLISGGDGNDVALMAAGDDTFTWNPGDDNDTLEGQAGLDRLLFNGANVAENMSLFPNGGRVIFFRDVASVTMDLNDVETLELNTLGGADTLTINDLTGTDLTSINVELASTVGGTTTDGAADTIRLNGSNGDDIITATFPVAGQVLVNGLSATLLVEHFDSSLDALIIQGLAGHDVIDGSAIGAGGPLLTLDGGLGDDILLGSVGADSLLGGDNDDVLMGNLGVDTLDGGTGENIAIQDGGNVTTGIVSIFGDDTPNTITISRDGGGNILSNGVPIPGATIANTFLIRVFGRGGNDVITLDQTQGALPAAALYGGAGDDAITGGAGGDLIFGGIDNDDLLGTGGFDWLFGGAGDDTLTGGDADDEVFAEAGHDTFVWNPGDDTDLNEGGSGIDTVTVNGGNGDEQFTVTANGTRVRFDRVNPAPFTLDIGTCENLVLNANGGNDSLACTGNLAALIHITADGGAGDDTLLGSNGDDSLMGGDNNDFIDGQQGLDTVFMGAGNDVFQWDPGDGNDTIEGQDGQDIVLFNGSNGSEVLTFSANGQRLLFTRNLGSVSMNADGIERFDLRTLGSADAVTVNSLAGTVLTQVNIDLASTVSGGAGDAAADAITVNGTTAPDTIQVSANAGTVSVAGLAAQINITHSEPALDTLTVNGLGGADTLTQGPGVAALIILTLNQ